MSMDRHLNADDHVVLHRRNRNLVSGITDRVPLDVGRCFLFAVLTALCLIFVVGSGVAIVADDISGSGILLALLLGVAAIGGAAMCAALCVAATVSFSRDRARFEQHGRLVTGEVVEARTVRTKSSLGYPPGAVMTSTSLEIAYRFRTLAGEERTGRVVLDKVPPRIPSSGDRLAILYAADSPRRASPEQPEDRSPKGSRRALLARVVDDFRIEEIVL